MKTKIYPSIIALVAFTAIGLQGCFEPDSNYWGPGRHVHEQQEFQYGPKHEVCDARGNNCMVCDADNDYCRRLPNTYGPYSRLDRDEFAIR
jgi:hypothetical protein